MVTEQERQNAIARAEAEIQFEAVLASHNIKLEDLQEIIDNSKWVTGLRTGVIRVQWATALGILALAVSGLMAALWEGIKHSMRH